MWTLGGAGVERNDALVHPDTVTALAEIVDTTQTDHTEVVLNAGPSSCVPALARAMRSYASANHVRGIPGLRGGSAV